MKIAMISPSVANEISNDIAQVANEIANDIVA